MTKKKTPTKRGPKEERLVTREDPQQALTRLLKPTLKAVKNLKAEFDEAHAKGMDPLKSHDYRAFGKAIQAERTLISKQRELSDKNRDLIDKRRTATKPPIAND